MRYIKKFGTHGLLLSLPVLFGSAAVADTDLSAIDSVVQKTAQSTMRQYNIPGLAIAVTVNGQQRFYNYGVASKQTQQKVTRNTLFELGSVSKTLTATLATYAQANGLLSLTDTPGKYLPALKDSALDKTTLINLGTHTAGGFPLQLPDEVHTAAQLIDYFKHWRPTYAPGTGRSYANPSIGLLGMVVANSMKMPFAQAMEQQLFPGLGMPGSYINVPKSKLSLYAQGYDKNDAPVRLNPGVLADEAYGVKSSAKDLLRFVEVNLNLTATEAKLRQATLDTHIGYYTVGAMTQDLIWEQYSYPTALNTLIEGNSNAMLSQNNAVAEIKPPLPPQPSVLINKTGSTNGFGTYVVFVPEKKFGIVLLANKNYPNEARVRLAYGILEKLECCSGKPLPRF